MVTQTPFRKGLIILWDCWISRVKDIKTGKSLSQTMASPIRAHIDLIDGTLTPPQMKRAGIKDPPLGITSDWHLIKAARKIDFLGIR